MDELQSELQSGCRPDFTAPRASLGVSVDIPTLWTRLEDSFVYSIQFYRLKNYFFFFFFSFRNSASISFVQACVSYELTYVLESFFTVFFFFTISISESIDFFFKQITLTDDRSSCTFEMTTNNSFQATITPNNIFFFFLSKASLCTDYAKRRERKREREREREKEKKTEKKNTTTTEFVSLEADRSRVRVFRSTKNVPILAWPSFP